MERTDTYERHHLKATELRLGLPGTDEPQKQSPATASIKSNKRALPESAKDCSSNNNSCASDVKDGDCACAPSSKAQVVGWPPVRSYRKNCFQQKKNEPDVSGMYIKVSMDGAPYLRKIDLKVYKSYPELLTALENMFRFTIGEYSEKEGYNGSEYVPTYEDKDSDWMLVGDVPWDMFTSSCKRLRIMKGSEARGLGCV
ncbi:AUX/IAA domain [Dillenia turbinata]|uniref:Auxin-responsive protein n=1 Tax=Dillenia turbinata TaxID=194707 RepID=A0AAN8ZK15_9MAGN